MSWNAIKNFDGICWEGLNNFISGPLAPNHNGDRAVTAITNDGTKLLIETQAISNKVEPSGFDQEECMHKMLQAWLNSGDSASMNILITASTILVILYGQHMMSPSFSDSVQNHKVDPSSPTKSLWHHQVCTIITTSSKHFQTRFTYSSWYINKGQWVYAHT